jgi:hypothetical protein
MIVFFQKFQEIMKDWKDWKDWNSTHFEFTCITEGATEQVSYPHKPVSYVRSNSCAR